MPVTVTHYTSDSIGQVRIEHKSSSWQIDDKGNLIIADSYGDPEAAYSANNWLNVVKVEPETDDDSDDEFDDDEADTKSLTD